MSKHFLKSDLARQKVSIVRWKNIWIHKSICRKMISLKEKPLASFTRCAFKIERNFVKSQDRIKCNKSSIKTLTIVPTSHNCLDWHKQVVHKYRTWLGEKKYTKKENFKRLYFQPTPRMVQVTLCLRAYRGWWQAYQYSASGVYTWPSYRPRLVMFKIPILNRCYGSKMWLWFAFNKLQTLRQTRQLPKKEGGEGWRIQLSIKKKHKRK